MAPVMLVTGQVPAEVTGLASGAIKSEGLWMVIVWASLAIYTTILAVMGVGGVRLLRHLFRAP